MLEITRKLSSGPTKSFGQFQEMPCVLKVVIYLFKKEKKRCMNVFSVIQLWLLLATALLVGSFKIFECSKFYSDNLQCLVIFLMFWCVLKYHRYALSLNDHALPFHAVIFLEEERENSLAVHVFKSRNVGGGIQRGELLRHVRKRSG